MGSDGKIINLTRERIRRRLQASIMGEIDILWDSDFDASIKELFVRRPGQADFEPWECYGDGSGGCCWLPWNAFS